jgi:predicted histone-like DNA-binding protein
MEYIMQEMPDVHKTGEKKFYPKVKHAHCIGHETIGNAYVDLTTMPRSWFEGVMKGLPEVLNSYLEEGHSVKIDGFGTFDLILGLLTEEERNSPKRQKVHANQDGVYIKKINFLPDQEWVRGLRKSTELNRVEGYREKLEASSSLEERRQMMLSFIEAKGCMTVRDYMDRTGFGSRVAARELNAFCQEPESVIRCTMVGKSKVYVKK